jgi:hypothetical protein
MISPSRGKWTWAKAARALTAIIALLLAYGLWATWYAGELDQPDWGMRVIEHAVTW